jgi:3-hydroxyisobutyrate dehydrogenase-like beta-hydroxyacid dehydrogenase
MFKVESSGHQVIKPFFKLDHMLKDVRLCLEEAKAAGVPFDFAQATEAILTQASAMGHGEHDFAALIDAVERQAGTRFPESG